MSQQTSCMFLSNVTLIDAAYVDHEGRARGISVSPLFEVSGAVTEDEQVVIDFSKCRKMLKALIDDKEHGYDHKLWVDRNDVSQFLTTSAGTELHTPYFDMLAPRNAYRVTSLYPEDFHKRDIHTQRSSSLRTLLKQVAEDMGQWLTEQLADLNVIVKVQLPRPVGTSTYEMYGTGGYTCRRHFSYTHGLPASSSWGCQNILHGHTSFIDLIGPDDTIEKLSSQIQDALDNAYFYDSANVNLFGQGTGKLGLSYTTERGLFNLRLHEPENTGHPVRCYPLNCAPTIENIVEWVADRFAQQLEASGVVALAVSEGLWKGAVIKQPTCDWVARAMRRNGTEVKVLSDKAFDRVTELANDTSAQPTDALIDLAKRYRQKAD